MLVLSRPAKVVFLVILGLLVVVRGEGVGRAQSAPQVPWSIQEARKAAEADPTSHEALEKLGDSIIRAYDEQGGPKPGQEAAWTEATQRAAALFDALIKSGKLSKRIELEAVAMQGALLARLGKNEEAIAAMDKNLKVNPDNLFALEQMLRVYQRTKQAHESEALCQRTRKAVRGKKVFEDFMLMFLSYCIALHPDFPGGKPQLSTFSQYLPWASKADLKVISDSIGASACGRSEDSCRGACRTAACNGCNERPWDAAYTKHCKDNCQGCMSTCDSRLKECIASQK